MNKKGGSSPGNAGEWVLSQDLGLLAAEGDMDVSCLGIESWFINRQPSTYIPLRKKLSLPEAQK